MEKFPRGTLPPSVFVPLAAGNPPEVKPAPSTIQRLASVSAGEAQAPRGTCDLSMTCPTCGTLMAPEHAHYRCGTCGYRDSCCF